MPCGVLEGVEGLASSVSWIANICIDVSMSRHRESFLQNRTCFLPSLKEITVSASRESPEGLAGKKDTEIVQNKVAGGV